MCCAQIQPYYLPTLDSTIEQRSLPLGYAWEKEQPHPQKICDAKDCIPNDHDYSRLLTCGHSFHLHCMVDDGCPICLPNLLMKINAVPTTFNKGLLEANDDNLDDEEDDDPDDDHDDDDDDPKTKNPAYFSSKEFFQSLKDRFKKKITEE